MDLVEAESARDDRLECALGKIWIVATGLPPEVVERIVIAGMMSFSFSGLDLSKQSAAKAFERPRWSIETGKTLRVEKSRPSLVRS